MYSIPDNLYQLKLLDDNKILHRSSLGIIFLANWINFLEVQLQK